MYVLIWEFHVKPDQIADFERMYGPEGDWVRFFRKGTGYLGTELLRKDDGSYLTTDRWESQQSYVKFREQYKSEYEALDRKCESLTELEKQVGAFLTIAWKNISRNS
jgi:heme-degrading monooxygenase HmoA